MQAGLHLNHPMEHIVVSLLADVLHFPSAVLQSHLALPPPPHLQEDVIVGLLCEVDNNVITGLYNSSQLLVHNKTKISMYLLYGLC